MAKNTVSDASNIFTAPLLVINKKMESGAIYNSVIADRICERLNTKPSIIVQEMNPVERKMKNISPAEPWDKKIMANVISAQISNGLIIFTAECKNGRDGKILNGMIKQYGIDGITFFPVGYGTHSNGQMDNYELKYIGIELKR